MIRAKAFVLAIDQGTTGSRAILYDQKGKQVFAAYREFRQFYPRPGWVEHDPEEIWRSVLTVTSEVLNRAHISSQKIAAVGITNQRETFVLWDRDTGRALHRAIVWQDRRTTDLCETLKKRSLERTIRMKTGLVLDPYFSAAKVTWMLKQLASIRRQASQGKLCFGTIDTWLLWRLTGGQSHKTDPTNASRTLLFNIRSGKWDLDLLKLFQVPASLLPEVTPSASLFGKTVRQGPWVSGVPIFSMMGDQQSALYGQGCYDPGTAKNTYGTGCFMMLNVGKRFLKPPFGLLTTLACDRQGFSAYALEGAIFIAGAAMQWLRDGLEFFKHASESEFMIQGLKDSGGITVIPAFVGLASPYWNSGVRGRITGVTRGTTRAHIIRATLESIAHQSADVLEAMMKNVAFPIRELRVDGGVTANHFLMQFQADLLRIPILVSDLKESTAWGAAKLAARKAGVWTWGDQLDHARRYDAYYPRMSRHEVLGRRQIWKREVQNLLLGFQNPRRYTHRN